MKSLCSSARNHADIAFLDSLPQTLGLSLRCNSRRILQRMLILHRRATLPAENALSFPRAELIAPRGVIFRPDNFSGVYPAGPTAILHRPDPIMIVAEPSFVVELANVKLPF